MSSPLFRVVVQQPELLLDHAQAYAELFEAEITALGSAYGRRARLATAMLCFMAIGATLSGVAVMLVSVMSPVGDSAVWTLGVVPILPFGAALWCYLALRAPAAAPFEVLRHQMQTDMQMLRGLDRS